MLRVRQEWGGGEGEKEEGEEEEEEGEEVVVAAAWADSVDEALRSVTEESSASDVQKAFEMLESASAHTFARNLAGTSSRGRVRKLSADMQACADEISARSQQKRKI